MHHTKSRIDEFIAAQSALQSGRILVIEDSPEFSGYMRSLLRRKGYEAHFTNSGRDGLRMANSLRPDLIMLDLALPGMNGFEVFRLLRAETKTHDTPVLLVTGLDDPSDLLGSASVAIGADDFLRKPFGENELLVRVGVLLKRQRFGRHLELGPVRAEPATGKAWVCGEEKSLGPRRFELLCLLLRRPEGVTCAALVERGWEPDTVRKTIQRLNAQLFPACRVASCRKGYKLFV